MRFRAIFNTKDRYRPLLEQHERWRARARVLKLSKRAMLRLEWIIYYYTKANKSAALTSRHFGIARKVFYDWFNRFDELNLASLEDRSKRPHTLRTKQYTALEVTRLQELRRTYPTLGREKLAVLYQEQYGDSIKPWSLRRIICDYQLYAQRAVRVRRSWGQKQGHVKKRVTELTKQPFPGFLLEVDTIVIYYAGGKRYILTAVDHHSRVAFARMYKTKHARNAADFLRRLVVLLGGEVKNIHIDNGTEFEAEFRQAATELDIDLYHARPYTPKDKPLVERFNGILQQEFVNLGNFTTDPDQFNQDLTEWLIFYNFVRPHHSLGLKRPAEFANMKAMKVLPMWSPMTRS